MSSGMAVYPIADERFKKYGRIMKGFSCEELLKKMQETPMTNSVEYVASVPELERLPIFNDLRVRAFCGMDIQLGYCNGVNHKQNAVEYHRTSEINIAATDLIEIIGLRQDINPENFTYDASKMEAFLIPAGTMFEFYATTLHYAPCSASVPFRCAVVLPRGTGRPLKKAPCKEGEDALLLAANKWVIGHAESGLSEQGGFIGLTGENPSV